MKRVTQNRGRNTPGVDGVVWRTPLQKIRGVSNLKRRGYRSAPLRRIYIPKRNGKKRPLSIPTMKDRAMQALHLLGLEPVSEMILDNNAYGFRPKRNAADAIEQCFIVLARKTSAQYVLECDIKSCFDKISHDWILKNITMDKVILKEWLTAGFIERQRCQNSLEGTPQGGIISPTLMNITLAGLEKAVKSAVKCRNKVNIIMYADDFVITSISKEVLENKVKPAVENFLAKRGLELSSEKTHISHIDTGFDFLGFNVRKYKGKLLIKPSKDSIKRFLKDIRETVKSKATIKTEYLIPILNNKIRGWANYFKHVVSKKTFSYVDCHIFRSLWKWAKRRHPNKPIRWIVKKYYCHNDGKNWTFFSSITTEDRNKDVLLFKASRVPIVRHIKIKGKAKLFDPKYKDYFLIREKCQRAKKTFSKAPTAESSNRL